MEIGALIIKAPSISKPIISQQGPHVPLSGRMTEILCSISLKDKVSVSWILKDHQRLIFSGTDLQALVTET